jgi:hypothetical protein
MLLLLPPRGFPFRSRARIALHTAARTRDSGRERRDANASTRTTRHGVANSSRLAGWLAGAGTHGLSVVACSVTAIPPLAVPATRPLHHKYRQPDRGRALPPDTSKASAATQQLRDATQQGDAYRAKARAPRSAIDARAQSGRGVRPSTDSLGLAVPILASRTRARGLVVVVVRATTALGILVIAADLERIRIGAPARTDGAVVHGRGGAVRSSVAAVSLLLLLRRRGAPRPAADR